MPTLKGYPQSNGTKKVAVLNHVGPASYTQFAGGGDVLNGQGEAGVTWLEHVTAGLDPTGTYRVEVANPVAGAATVKLRWVVVATGAEVAGDVNLSTVSVTLNIRGF